MFTFHTYLWYWACKKLNSSLIRSMDSTMFNLKGCGGWLPVCGPWGTWKTKKKFKDIKWNLIFKSNLLSEQISDSLFNFSSSDISLQISNSLCLDPLIKLQDKHFIFARLFAFKLFKLAFYYILMIQFN